MTINELLDIIQANSFRAAFLSLLIYSIYFSRRDSFVITLCSMCLLNLAHMALDDLMMKWYDQGYEQLVYHAWYLFFAATDFAFCFVAYTLVDRFKLEMQKVSRVVIFSFLTLGIVQVLRYADRIVLETDYFGWLYTASIPAINSGVTISVLVYALGAVYMHRVSVVRGD